MTELTWQGCAGAGYTGLPVDPAWGGRGATFADSAAAFRDLGRSGAAPGLLFALGAQLWSVTMTIARFGSDEQRAAWLPALCAGGLVAGHAMTEPESGSDAFGLRTTATAVGDRVVIDGAKTFVTNGPAAGLFLVFATADRAAGWAGISAYLVARDTPGLTVGRAMRTMSAASAGWAELRFDHCEVPLSARLGPAGAGLSVFTAAMELERSLLPAGMVGLVDHRLAEVAARGVSGVGADRLAGLRVRRATTWALVERAAAALDCGRKAPTESALAKLAASELWRATANLAVDCRGAHGMLAGSEVDLADAAAATIYSGTSEIQREMLGHRLKLPA